MLLPCLGKEEDCIRDTTRSEFVSYRRWYGVVPPEHESSIYLGDLGRFTKDGEFVKLGGMFESSEKQLLKYGNTAENWIGVSRPLSENIAMAEELVFDPFVSRTTGWAHVPDDQMQDIKFLALKRQDRNSLTYEYVKPTTAVKLGQLRKNKWAHALLLGGPLQRHQMHHPNVIEWVRLNSKALRRQLESLSPAEQDAEFGLVLVLTTFTSPGYTDVRFLNAGDTLGPVILGCTPGASGNSKWLRGYPLESGRTSFDGEFISSEGPGVEGGWTIFLDGYSIKKASTARRLIEAASDIMRFGEAKKEAAWKRDITIRKISEI